MIKAISFLLLLPLFACSESAEHYSSSSSAVATCTQRGVKYFKEIGSYPTLSSGKDATATAKARCNRTTSAF
jgi:heat shock protein HslJ